MGSIQKCCSASVLKNDVRFSLKSSGHGPERFCELHFGSLSDWNFNNKLSSLAWC